LDGWGGNVCNSSNIPEEPRQPFSTEVVPVVRTVLAFSLSGSSFFCS
jgi:hypothetical protein